MARNHPNQPVSSGRKLARRLRLIAWVVLCLGILGAAAAYWGTSTPAEMPADTLNTDDSKRAQRDIEVNFGKMGLLVNDLTEDLQDPGTRALIIVVVAVLAAGGCFYFARLLEFDDEPDPGPAAG